MQIKNIPSSCRKYGYLKNSFPSDKMIPKSIKPNAKYCIKKVHSRKQRAFGKVLIRRELNEGC